MTIDDEDDEAIGGQHSLHAVAAEAHRQELKIANMTDDHQDRQHVGRGHPLDAHGDEGGPRRARPKCARQVPLGPHVLQHVHLNSAVRTKGREEPSPGQGKREYRALQQVRSELRGWAQNTWHFLSVTADR